MTNVIKIASEVGFTPRIGTYVAQLEEVRERTRRYTDGLSPRQLAWHPGPDVESIGTLLIHIAAVEVSWIQEDLLRRPMGEEWKIAFPIRFGLTQVSDRPLEFFWDKLDTARVETRAALTNLTDVDLDRAVVPLDQEGSTNPGQFTIEWILYHLVEHEAHHKGQIAVMKRLLDVSGA